MGEYRQAFKNSNLIVDAGYTEGYKNTSSKEKWKQKSFFQNLLKTLKVKQGSDNSLNINLQNVEIINI